MALTSSVGAASVADAGQGTGDPVLTVTPAEVPAGELATITITGTDYLVPPYAPGTDVFGGVYVFFGWVSDPARFGPSVRSADSTDGQFGFTYVYPGAAGGESTRDEGAAGGMMSLVSFTAGGESGELATDFMDRDGNWTTQIEIRGSQFTYAVPGATELRTVDCQQVQCGIYTIGAHGKASATNELFTPLTFTGTWNGPLEPSAPSSTAAPTLASTVPVDASGAQAPTDLPAETSTETSVVRSTEAEVTGDAAELATVGGATTGGSGSSGSGGRVALIGAIVLGALAGIGSGVYWFRRRVVAEQPA